LRRVCQRIARGRTQAPAHPKYEEGTLSARMRVLLVGVVAAVVAAISVGTAAAAPNDSGLGKSLHLNYVSPQATLADSSDFSTPVYALRTCQVTPSPPNSIAGSQCYDPYQMQHAYGADSLIAGGYDGTGKTIVILDAFDASPYTQNNFNTFN